MAYKKLIKVSNVCQLLDKSKYPATTTINGVTFTNNGDGTITANGTAKSGSGFRLVSLNTFYIEGNRTYLMIGCPEGGSPNDYFMYDGYSKLGSDLGSGIIKTVSGRTLCSPILHIVTGRTVSNLVFKPQLFDLTEMYGAGNEPTTVAQFRQDFPEEIYDYKPYCFVKSYKKLIKVSNVCQLLDKSKYPATTTKEGITWTNNGDGTITANGTATAFTNILVDTVTPTIIKSGHKFLMLGCPLSNGNITTSKEYWMQEGYEFASDHGGGKFFSLKGNNINLRIYIQKDYTADNLTFKPQIFDLTEMYGAGHEPTTVEQFRQDFPEEMYNYKPYSIITSHKRNLTCKTKNLFHYPYHDGTKTSNGITFTDNGNGTINLSGTSTRQANYYFYYETLNLKKGVTYTLSASGDYSCSDFFNFYIYNSTYGQVCYIVLRSGNKAKSFTPSQDINGINCYLVVPSDITVSGTLKPMLELGDTATGYVPYGYL